MRPYVVDRQCAVVHPYVVDLLYVVDLPWVVDLPCVDDPPCGEKMRKTHYTLKNRALETDNRKSVFTQEQIGRKTAALSTRQTCGDA